MPRSLRFSRQAQRDFQNIRKWFNQPGAGTAAAERLNRLEASILALVDRPYAWPPGPKPGTRLLISQRHVILYRIAPDTGDTQTAGNVFLVRIFGPGQSDTGPPEL